MKADGANNATLSSITVNGGKTVTVTQKATSDASGLVAGAAATTHTQGNVTVTAGVILMTLGLLPKFAALATVIPNSVLGGAMIALFGIVAASGIRMLQQVDFSKTSNLLVVACSISMGIGASVVTPLFAKMPEMFHILFGSGIVSGSVTAILLNLFFNFDEVMGKSSEQIFNEVAHVDEGVF